MAVPKSTWKGNVFLSWDHQKQPMNGGIPINKMASKSMVLWLKVSRKPWYFINPVGQPIWMTDFGVSAQGNITDRVKTFWLMIPMRFFQWRAAMLMTSKTMLAKTTILLKTSTFQCWLNQIYWRIKDSLFHGNSWTHPQFIT